jgi:hypothetical protein
MSEEHLRSIHSLQQLGEPPKRRRTPSQYATQIADFKNVAFFLLRTSTLLLRKQKQSSLQMALHPMNKIQRSIRASR